MASERAKRVAQILREIDYLTGRKPVIVCECECRVISEEDIPNEEAKKDD